MGAFPDSTCHPPVLTVPTESIKMEKTHVDVLYFLTCHERPDVILDQITNIRYYSKLTCHIILHSNPAIIAALTDKLPSFVSLHPVPCAKERFTYSLYHALIECFVYSQRLGIRSKYCIILASNCMFHKDITNELLESYMAKRALNPVVYKPPTNNWNTALKNPELVSILSTLNSQGFQCAWHEGSLIEYEVFEKITNFTLENRLWEKIQHTTCYEELIMINLYVHYTGYYYPNINAFPNGPNEVPSISQIKTMEQPCFKPCPRDINHILRVWLRSRYVHYN
jgi:hypothetical protein